MKKLIFLSTIALLLASFSGCSSSRTATEYDSVYFTKKDKVQPIVRAETEDEDDDSYSKRNPNRAYPRRNNWNNSSFYQPYWNSPMGMGWNNGWGMGWNNGWGMNPGWGMGWNNGWGMNPYWGGMGWNGGWGMDPYWGNGMGWNNGWGMGWNNGWGMGWNNGWGMGWNNGWNDPYWNNGWGGGSIVVSSSVLMPNRGNTGGLNSGAQMQINPRNNYTTNQGGGRPFSASSNTISIKNPRQVIPHTGTNVGINDMPRVYNTGGSRPTTASPRNNGGSPKVYVTPNEPSSPRSNSTPKNSTPRSNNPRVETPRFTPRDSPRQNSTPSFSPSSSPRSSGGGGGSSGGHRPR